MYWQRIKPGDLADKCFTAVQNDTSGYMSAGYHVVYENRTLASANGYNVVQPVTSSLALYAGVVDAGIAASSKGLIQAWGYRGAAYISGSNTAYGVGTILGPITGAWDVHDKGLSTGFGPVILMSEDATNTVHLAPVFIRGL